jgi:hypothetical protein
MKFSLWFVLSCLTTSFALGQARDPSGERAYYKLDRSGSRTSSMITEGHMVAKVAEHFSGSSSFQVDIDYKLKIQVLGNQTGTESISVPSEYFSEEFLEELRENGRYESSKFKVKHQGFADATTINGEHYDECDKLFIYDIDSKAMPFFRNLFKQLAVQDLYEKGMLTSIDSEIQDLQITALVKYGLPVLGAVKIDMKGKYEGMNIKAGADFRP